MMEENKKNTSLEFANKMYRYMKNDMPVEEFQGKFHLNNSELNGIIELCHLYGKKIEIIINSDNVPVFKKNPLKISSSTKQNRDSEELIHTEIGLVSDTHFGNIHQQLHLLNEFYQEAYNRGIKDIYHVGDVTDGNYLNRPESVRQQFLHGFDEQAGYVVDMYPEVEGIDTEFILGSHDETHYKNGGATIGYWIPRVRKDMKYLGQDFANIEINGVRITLDHPGGGSSKSLSYNPQKRIEILESGFKPHILAIGHYHKNYEFVYRNVRGIEVPCFCDKTQFQQKQGLLNVVGGYFLDIYSDKKGNIHYFEAEDMTWGHEDMWDEAGKDKKKVRKLKIGK